MLSWSDTLNDPLLRVGSAFHGMVGLVWYVVGERLVFRVAPGLRVACHRLRVVAGIGVTAGLVVPVAALGSREPSVCGG